MFKRQFLQQQQQSIDSNEQARQLDVALRRAQTAEMTVDRLKAGCVTMRSQVEAGLRYKMENEKLSSELQMCKVCSHYDALTDIFY